MVWRMVWKDPAPARRAVSTALRTAVSYSDDVARQMSQAGLMQRSMPLLRAISVGRPNARLMPVHGFAHDLGRAGEVGHMDDGALAAKPPMVGIDAFPCAKPRALALSSLRRRAPCGRTCSSKRPG